MTNETTIKIKLNADGQSYTAEIVEAEAKTGTRLDQQVARTIIQMDERLRDPQTLQMIQNARRNPQGMLMQMMNGMMSGGGGSMNPMQMMRGMFGRQ